MLGLVQVAILAGVATVLADEWAHRDELAARRFRELNTLVVMGELDRSRNNRWHSVGFRQRAEVVGLIAGIVLAVSGSWLASGLAVALVGATVALVFDISFNLRLGLPWHYAGSTAAFDEWLNHDWKGMTAATAGKAMAAVKLLVVVGSAVAWLILV